MCITDRKQNSSISKSLGCFLFKLHTIESGNWNPIRECILITFSRNKSIIYTGEHELLFIGLHICETVVWLKCSVGDGALGEYKIFQGECSRHVTLPVDFIYVAWSKFNKFRVTFWFYFRFYFKRYFRSVDVNIYKYSIIWNYAKMRII